MRERHGGMREEVRSSGTADPPFVFARSSSPPATPVASSAGASSPAPIANVASSDWLGNNSCQVSKTGPQQSRPALSTNLDTTQSSCRPWERGDLLRRLATFKPSTWSPKSKAISILSCSQRGWVNMDNEKIECESCGAHLTYSTLPSSPTEENLDSGHSEDCPWRGNSCPDSLLQFSVTPTTLIGGFKDRSDALLQFVSLPLIATSALETIRVTRSGQLDRLLSQPPNFLSGDDPAQLDPSSPYCQSQKLISLCGWEPRWLPIIQDCEENSTQSTRPVRGNNYPPISIKDKGKGKMPMKESKSSNTRSPLLDCSLCGSTVRIWDFRTVSRSNDTNIENLKKLTRGASAASVVNGNEGDGKSLSNADVDLNLTMAGGLPSTLYGVPNSSDPFNRFGTGMLMGRDLMIGQPTGSEVGDRAASYESRGPSSRKRNREEGGSTVDKPVHAGRVHQADSIEGTVIDRDGGDEVDDEINETGFTQDSNKRMRSLDLFGSFRDRPPRTDETGAGPSRTNTNFSFDNKPVRESTRASSVIAMDTVNHESDDDSMESVENYPGDVDDTRTNNNNNNNLDMNANSNVNANGNGNDGLDLNYSNQAQQSTCVVREVGGSSTNEGEEILNADNTVTANDRFQLDNRDQVSLGVSGGSVGMGMSHEAEIHGTEIINDTEPIAEVTENLAEVTENLGGHTGETIPGPEIMDLHAGDSQEQDMVSRSKADSGSKIYGSAKADSVESGEKGVRAAEPSLSCNAGIYSVFEVSKEEVTQMGNNVDFDIENGVVGATNGENVYDSGMGEFDPIRHHKKYCPWVNGNVAAASCEAGQDGSSSGSTNYVLLCGWQLTLDALDSCQSLGQGQNQTMQSESAASLYKDDHGAPSHKLMKRQSASKSHGKR